MAHTDLAGILVSVYYKITVLSVTGNHERRVSRTVNILALLIYRSIALLPAGSITRISAKILQVGKDVVVRPVAGC